MTQDHTVMKTLVEQSGDTVGKLNGTYERPAKKPCRRYANPARARHHVTQVRFSDISRK